ncbi:DUF4357 domain-containing protein [Aeromonas simiae]|uniref:DUF4357 domain-containing protein n=1 Tax=Aeromonas simiae TaxID=218936 RepID=A0A5J6WXA0_9GAMM|nr:DUF4357 domain-containing protein [Aeromonas simiae]MDO2947877.1 DUF4357 domain-containing protein [Aeromonas simiae]MDO2950950.1 DUF4357 domain-containing protein [Aeromonas simiae]MDO2955227.1 DUF4357 domain-containing protein [Aeromonas simiae]QFI54383.1 DUF4357 domain-containing protein [Aeromonas simiae]
MLHKQVNFIVDGKGNKQAAVVPIDIYEELMALQRALSDSRPGEREIYHFSVKGAEAQGYPVGKRHSPGFMVLAGSTANGEDAASLREAVVELRAELLGKEVLERHGEGYRFTQDHLFNSPSLAASLVAGNNRSGLDAWHNSSGHTLKQSGFGKKE